MLLRAPKRWRRALTTVPSSLPWAGWTTMPDALLRTARYSSSKRISRGRSCGAASAGRSGGMDPVMMSPGFRARLGLAVLPPARIAPSRRSD
jgi:hypothetical protein